MKKIIILILIFAAVTCLYPLHDFNARYLEVDIKYTLKEDGTQIFDYFHRVKLLNATRGFGESFIKYNPDFQKLEVISSVTTMVDGKKVKTPDNGYNEVLPREAKRFAAFSHLKEMVVSHTGIERGAEIELRYRIITKKGFIPYFTGKEFFTKNVPVDKYVLTAELPEGEKLNYKVFNYSMKPEVKSADGTVSYIFRGKNIAADRRNSYVKSYDRPYILFSNLKTAENLFPEVSGRDNTCKGLEDIISGIKKKDMSKREIVKTIKEKIIDSLENCHVGLKLSGFKTRSVKDILRSGYATSLEKVLISKVVLDRFYPGSRLTTVSPGFDLSDNLFSFLQSAVWIFVIDSDEGDLYIKPGKPGTDLGLTEYFGIPLVDIVSGKTLPARKCEMKDNSIILKGKVSLKDDKFSGNIRLLTSGSFYNYFGFLKAKDKLYKKTIGKIFPLSKVKNIKVLKVTPGFMEITGDVEAGSGKWDYKSFLFLKSFKIPLITKSMVSRDSIMYPVTIGAPFLVKVSLSVVVPDGYTFDMIRKNEKIDNSTGIYEYSLKEEKKGHVDIDLKFGLKDGKISKENYPSLKQLIDSALSGEFQVILKKVQKKN